MTPLGDPRQAEVLAIILAGVLVAGLMVEVAHPATLGVWTGPGDRACAGRCPEAWAAAQLPEARRAELAASDAPAVAAAVAPGALVSLMTYHDGARALAQRGVVAMIEHPEPATCRQMDGWRWCQIHACQNWAAVEAATYEIAGEATPRGYSAPATDRIANRFGPATHLISGAAGAQTLGLAALIPPVRRGNAVTPTPAGGETPAPIPLPSPALLLLSALGFLIRRALRVGARPGARRPGARSSLTAGRLRVMPRPRLF